MYWFRNDYSRGAHPKVLAALAAANDSSFPGYGEDPHSARAVELIRALCACPQAEVQFMVGGTQTNAIAIHAFLRPWEGVISPASGHINGHECGAVEALGHKILTVPTGPDGKLTPQQILPIVEEHRFPHLVLPRLVYLSNATESGAIYTRAELEALSACCRENGLLLYVDGARLGCALTAPGNDVTLADLARLTDAFYLGGTKNGALMGEALIISNPDLQPHFFRIKKQQGALLAKGFLLGLQFEALLEDGLYFRLAGQANGMALRLQEGLTSMGWSFASRSCTNQIFPIIDSSLLPMLDQFCQYEVWGPAQEPGHMVIRFATSFATTQEEVDGLLAALRPLSPR
jgi:threonine aldolase